MSFPAQPSVIPSGARNLVPVPQPPRLARHPRFLSALRSVRNDTWMRGTWPVGAVREPPLPLCRDYCPPPLVLCRDHCHAASIAMPGLRHAYPRRIHSALSLHLTLPNHQEIRTRRLTDYARPNRTRASMEQTTKPAPSMIVVIKGKETTAGSMPIFCSARSSTGHREHRSDDDASGIRPTVKAILTGTPKVSVRRLTARASNGPMAGTTSNSLQHPQDLPQAHAAHRSRSACPSAHRSPFALSLSKHTPIRSR